MNTSQVLVCAVPEKVLNLSDLDVPDLMKELLGTEVRIARGINPDVELRRMQLYNDRIEAAVKTLVVGRHNIITLPLGAEYTDVMIAMYGSDPERAHSIRVGASVHPRASILKHAQEFEKFAKELQMDALAQIQSRLEFLRKAAKKKQTIFELQQGFNFDPELNLPSTQANLTDLLDQLEKQYEEVADVADEIAEIAGDSQEARLASQITSALEQTREGKLTRVSFSAQRNDVLAEVLRSFVYAKGEKQLLHLTYADGSEARPFPLYCLKIRTAAAMGALRKLPQVRIGLLSERHQEMDRIVNKYWFRNLLVSTGKPHGQIDQYCYEASKEIFEEIRQEGIYRIAIFPTGLEPANIGFYRALVEELMFRSRELPTLEVVPYYYVKEGYVQGQPWN